MKRLFLILSLILVFAACGGEETAPAIVALSTEAPAAVQSEPTSAPEPTAMPEPAATELPAPVVEAPATITPISAETEPTTPAEPTLEPTIVIEEAVAEPTAAPVGVTLLTQADFSAENRNPLTGEIIEADNLNRRPILCKISNSPAQWVRPQSGLNSADIMFEHYAEGTITRFSALFYGTTPEKVGPVRSARLIDLELPTMYDASLCFSGGSSGQGQFRGVYNKVFDQPFAPYILLTDSPGYYRTGEDKPYEHTFYNNLATSWQYLTTIGQNARPSFQTQMAFSDQVPANSADASHIAINYGGGTFVDWYYNAELGKYMRWADGTQVIDANDGAQVAVSNVIIIKAPHVIDYNICETQTETECIAFSTELQIWGTGFASIFRDGRQINGSWQRAERNEVGMMFTFTDDAGEPIPLQLGNSWIQFAPYEYIDTPITVEP